MEVKLKRGMLVRWVVDYKYFAAPPTSVGVTPQEPIYLYGIVLEASEVDPQSAVVFCFQDGTWTLLNMINDQFEILTGE